jgi:hypothetical protein
VFFQAIIPVEASWGPSDDYLQANQRVANDFDFLAIIKAVENNSPAGVSAVLHNNPKIPLHTFNAIEDPETYLSKAKEINYDTNMRLEETPEFAGGSQAQIAVFPLPTDLRA